MRELVWIHDPGLPLAEAREEWEQTSPNDEALVDWAARVQDGLDEPLTVELEELAERWAVSEEFLDGLLAADKGYQYLDDNDALLAEAAHLRFLRELR